MPTRVRLLALSTRATISLLLAGAFLVVVGFFDQYLGWDVFPPQVEKTLTAIFASSVALGAFGLAISFAAGIRDSVAALEAMVGQRGGETEGTALVLPRRNAILWLGALFGLLAVTVLGLNFANERILRERQKSFKRTAAEAMKRLAPRWVAETSHLATPCPTCASADLAQLVSTLRDSSFCNSVDLYVADPGDRGALWHYPVNDDEGNTKLSRLFIADDVERAIAQALSGDTAWIDQMNGDRNWLWYQPVRGANRKVLAVVRIAANPNESFRDSD